MHYSVFTFTSKNKSCCIKLVTNGKGLSHEVPIQLNYSINTSLLVKHIDTVKKVETKKEKSLNFIKNCINLRSQSTQDLLKNEH